MTPTHRHPPCTALILALTVAVSAPAAAATPTSAIDLGTPAVQSARGQKLKLVVPYEAAAGETFSATRFEVVAAQVPAGWIPPDPSTFTIIKPASGNRVVLQSQELVDAPEVVVTLRVADRPESVQTWRVDVPVPFGEPVAMASVDASAATDAERPKPRAPKRVARRTR
jgi:hypothetical protein